MGGPFFQGEPLFAQPGPSAKAAPAGRYPQAPGFKVSGTSQEAAEGIAPRAGNLCDLTLACLKRKPMTPEEVAAELGEPVHSIRPRFSQLFAQNLIVKTDDRRRAMGGRQAQVWRAAT